MTSIESIFFTEKTHDDRHKMTIKYKSVLKLKFWPILLIYIDNNYIH